MTQDYSRVGVVVPARDEEATISTCVASIREAARQVDMPVDIIVVCDACTDATAGRARSAGARTLSIDRRNVGAARSVGIAELFASSGPDGLWVATTDADSVVPANWLDRMLRAAHQGYAVVTGTVRVDDWRQHSPKLIAAYRHHYARGIGRDGHVHVHGANLGFSAAAYAKIGGSPPLALAEDHALVAAFVNNGLSVARIADLVVTTSARLDGRAPGGFSDFLRSLVVDDPLAGDTSPA